MYLSPLSPVLKKALVAASPDTINYLHTADSSALKQFFCEKVFDVLLRKQKMVVVIPDSMSASIPAKLLSPVQLAHYTMHYNKSESLSESQIERLQRLQKLSEIPVEAGCYKKHLQQQEHLQSQITTILDKIHNDDAAGPSLQELVLSSAEDPKVHLSKEARRKMSKIAIDDRTLNSIDRLQRSHRPYFDFILTSSHLTEGALSDTQSRKSAIEELGGLYKGINEVITGMEIELESVYAALEKSIREECKTWKSIRKELELAIFDNDLANGAMSFEAAYQEVMAPAKKLFYLRLALDRRPELNWGEAQLVLQGIDGIIANVEQTIEIQYRSLLKRMTPFNIHKPELKDVIEKAMSVIRAINKCSYIDVQLPLTYLQIGELKKQVNQVKSQLTLGLSALHDAQYCEYKMLIQEVGIAPEVLDALLSCHPSSWRTIINHNVRRHLIEDRYDDSISQLSELYTQFRREASNRGEIIITEVHNAWLRIRSKAVTDIKNAHWDIYKALWGEGECDYSTASLIAQMPAAFTAFCPIIVCHESDLIGLLELQSNIFQEVLFLDNRELSDKTLLTIQGLVRQVTVATSYDINPSSRLSDTVEVRSMYSSDIKFPEQSISTTELGTERYRAVLPVATALCDIMNSVSIYKVGGKLIFSFADSLFNQLFEHAAGLEMKHVIYRDTSDISPLVESLMLDKEVHFLVENDLINAEKTEHISWQQELLKNMSQLGIAVHNIAFTQLYKRRDDYLVEFCEKLDLVSDEITDATQAKLEFA